MARSVPSSMAALGLDVPARTLDLVLRAHTAGWFEARYTYYGYTYCGDAHHGSTCYGDAYYGLTYCGLTYYGLTYCGRRAPRCASIGRSSCCTPSTPSTGAPPVPPPSATCSGWRTTRSTRS